MVENKLECLVLGCGLDSFKELWAATDMGWRQRIVLSWTYGSESYMGWIAG